MSVPSRAPMPQPVDPDGLIDMLDATRDMYRSAQQHYKKMQAMRLDGMVLARKGGISPAKIAVVLGMTEGAVRKALQRAESAA